MNQRCLHGISAFFLFLVSVSTSAQELWDLPLDELVQVKVVSATRKENQSLRLPTVVTIVSGEELAGWGAENLADGLRMVAGMHVRQGPGDFPQYEATVRGNTADFMNVRTLFLIDGIPIRNPNAGFDPSWLPLSMIQRIEIVKGAASNLYGAGAFGGLVNVITKSGGETQSQKGIATVGLKTQEDAVEKRSLSGKSATMELGSDENAINYFATAQYADVTSSSETYEGHKYQDVFGKLAYKVSEKLTLSATTLLSRDRNQIAVTYADTPIKNDVLRLTTSANLKISDTSDFTINGYYTDFNHFLDYTNALEHYHNKGRIYGLSSQYSVTLSEHHSLLVGAEFSQEFGTLDTKATDYSTFPATIQTAGWTEKKQNNLGLYAQYDYSGWEKFVPIVGVRYDDNSGYGNAVSPRVGLSYLHNDNTTFYFSAGRGFRAPVYNETEILGFGKVGNPHLHPEYTMTYEVGAKSVLASTQNTLSLFKEDISKKIELVSTDPADPNALKTYENGGTATIYGLELDGWYKLLSQWRIFYNTTLLGSDDGQGKKIERLIDAKAVLGISWTASSWDVRLAAVHDGRRFFYNTNTAIPSDSEGRFFIPAVTTANFQIAKKFGLKTTGVLYVNNIADVHYKEQFSPFIEQDGSYLPGRIVGAKLSSSF